MLTITTLLCVALQTTQYTVRELVPIAVEPAAMRFEPGTRGMAISASGVAGGASVTDTATRDVHACRWLTDGSRIDLSPLAGDVHSMALGGNGAGDLVGVSYRIGELDVHGVLWSADGGVTTLGTLQPVDINASGAIAGSQRVGGNPPLTTRAVRRTGSTAVELPNLTGGLSARAAAINNAGWLVGCGLLPDLVTTRACIWTGTTAPTDLGTLGGANSWARDVDGTVAVGVAETADGIPHAVRWTLDAAGAVIELTDLGTREGARTSAAEAIHPDGRIGGTSDDHAVLFESSGVVDLNTLVPSDSGWVLTQVTALGDGGRIVGRGRLHGLPRGFVLEPDDGPIFGDLDGNGLVNGADLAILLGAWDNCKNCSADLDQNGIVNGADLALLLGAWLGQPN